MNARIIKMPYAEYIYVLWKERNSRIFEDQTKIIEQLAREVHGKLRTNMQQLSFRHRPIIY